MSFSVEENAVFMSRIFKKISLPWEGDTPSHTLLPPPPSLAPSKIVNRAYTLQSSLDFYLLFENFTSYNYIRFHIPRHNSIFFILAKFRDV